MNLQKGRKVKIVKKLLASVAVLAFSSAAFATPYTINFQEMADGAWGESAWNPLAIDVDGNGTTDVNIFGKYGGATVFAYLDSGKAGLGTCRDLNSTGDSNLNKKTGSGTNLCQDSSDDNVNIYDGFGEELQFKFLKNLDITGIWFNNNHDPDKNLQGDYITIGSVTHLFDAAAGDPGKKGWLYEFNKGDGNTGMFTGGQQLSIKYADEQFYISAVVFEYTPTNPDIPVPLPSTLVLLGLGLAGLGARQRRN
jgi:hypothetical protein